MLNENKLAQIGIKVYNEKADMILDEKTNKYIASDEGYIKQLCEKTFGDGSLNADPSMLHQFNNILVKTADYVIEPTITEMLNTMANFQSVDVTATVIYDVPQLVNRPKIMYSAVGSTADLIRMSQDTKKIPAQRRVHTFAVYYNPLDFVTDSVKTFNDTINQLAEEKLRRYFGLVMQCIDKAVASHDIPVKNNLKASNITIGDYRKLENRFIRWGGKPVLVADATLIDALASQLVQTTSQYRSEALADELRGALQITNFSRTTAVNINNPFIDMAGTKTQYPEGTGYIFAGSLAGKKPIQITEFGGMRQTSEQNNTDKRIKMQIDWEADVSLLFGRLMGVVKDDAIL
jgi:hypothetical protein